MPLLTKTDYTVSPLAGVTTEQWALEVNETWGGALSQETHRGIISYPTSITAQQRGVLFIPGGVETPTLLDADIAKLQAFAAAGSTAYGDATDAGIVLMSAVPRGTPADIWTDGLVSGGVGDDDFGGPNTTKDVAMAFAAMMELGTGANTPYVHPFKAGIMGYSAGGLRILNTLKAGEIEPAACFLRSPLTDIYSWDSLPGTNKVAMATALGFTVDHITNALTVTFDELEGDEQSALLHRSARYWCKELPYIPYFLGIAELDDKVSRVQTDDFYDAMKAAGHNIKRLTCPTATHSFSTTNSWSNAIARGFFGKELA